MIEQPAIISLFSEKSVRDKWAPLLTKFPGLTITCDGQEIVIKRLNSESLDFIPRLAIISLDLYSARGNEIINYLRKYCPNLEIAVIASGEIPGIPLQSLIVDKIRHFTLADPINEFDRTYALLRTLAANKPWELSSYLNSDSNFHEFQIFDSNEKESVIGKIENLAAGPSQDMELLRQKGALLADEMIENALEAAPRGAISQQGIVVKVGFDGDTLALQVKDNWGTLTPEKTLEHLAQHQANEFCIDRPRGRGLFILWKFFDYFHVNITSGKETVIGGQLKRKSVSTTVQLKGFDFFCISPSRRSYSLSLCNSTGGFANA